MHRLPTYLLASGVVWLAACGGGSGGNVHPEPTPEVSYVAVFDRADMLDATAAYATWTLDVDGVGTQDRLRHPVSCTVTTCIDADGVWATLDTIVLPSQADSVAFSRRGHFDTVASTSQGHFELRASNLTLDLFARVENYSFWGTYGFANLLLGSGPLSLVMDGAPHNGRFGIAQAYVLGDASGSNPAGAGSAQWTGIVEASPVETFERLSGTATLTIDDLVDPEMAIAIHVPRHNINQPGWSRLSVSDGAFESGIPGSDYIGGHLHGPQHGEAWGYFDTDAYIGVFGAQRVH